MDKEVLGWLHLLECRGGELREKGWLKSGSGYWLRGNRRIEDGCIKDCWIVLKSTMWWVVGKEAVT